MKKQINEIKRMQLLAGVITESEYRKSLVNEELEPDFKEKAKAFINKHKNIIKDAVRFYKKRPDDYEESLIQTIYDFFEKELGEDWTTQISAPKPEDEKNYTYGWTDEKDEVFYNVLKSILEPGSSLNEAEKGNMITQNDIDTLHDKGFDIITDKDWDFVRIQKMLFAPKADWRFLNNLLSSRNISANMDYYRGDGDKGRSKELEISKKYFDKNLKYPPLGSKLK